jgi:high affinity Mn2+ porin
VGEQVQFERFRVFAGCLTLLLWLVPARASAQSTGSDDDGDETFSIMKALRPDHVRPESESWNAYGQFTSIAQWKPAFAARYTNVNGSNQSLLPESEASFTDSLTLFLGRRLWAGAEAYLVPEVLAEQPLSGLKGLGASVQNFELQKTGSSVPSLYRSRTFLRQTLNLGGEKTERTSGPSQLGTAVSARRLVLTFGTFTVIDLFDRSNVNWDLRQTFLNMAFMTHASWDFVADARGFSLGAVAELYWDDWAIRLGRLAAPRQPDQLPLEIDPLRLYGDTLELEHDHTLFGLAGAVHIHAYRSHELMGRFEDAVAAFEANPGKNAAACPATALNYGSENASAPDVCWVRGVNTKWGVGASVEQYIGPGIGVFMRAMYSDGASEVAGYTSADRDLSLGVVAKGQAWHRPLDVTGVAFASGWISSAHAQYLAMGGVDDFLGDGRLSPGAEMVGEVFYSVNLVHAVWLSADCQRIWNPGFNTDRGPVNVFGGRVHVEY